MALRTNLHHLLLSHRAIRLLEPLEHISMLEALAGLRCNANLCLLLKEGHHLSFALNKNLGYVMILTLE